MALLDDMFEGGIGTGLVAAVGVAVLAPVLKPVLRSSAKMAIKGGMVAYDYGRQAVAEITEMAGDLAAETRAEASGTSHTSSRTTRSS
jgi:hypothetical protein